MRSVRLPLIALAAIVSLAACSSDATAPEVLSETRGEAPRALKPTGPAYEAGTGMGSGARSASPDSVLTASTMSVGTFILP